MLLGQRIGKTPPKGLGDQIFSNFAYASSGEFESVQWDFGINLHGMWNHRCCVFFSGFTV